MANLSIIKADVKAVVEVMESFHGVEGFAAEDVARAVLEASFAIYEAKSSWMILGQLIRKPGTNEPLGPLEGDRVCFGPYGTETQARNAQAQLFYSKAMDEEYIRWLLPVHHGTPSRWFAGRKKAREAAEQAVKDGDYIKALPPEHQPPEMREAAQAAADARVERNRKASQERAWRLAQELKALQQEADPEVPRYHDNEKEAA